VIVLFARYAGDEAAAGISTVSHDIGSFHGGHLPDDLYARWVQFGAFQPIDRLHSDHGNRLPWQSNGALTNTAAGRCLDVPNGNTAPGAVQLQLYDCNGSTAQAWRLPPGPIAGPAGLCADVADADPASGTAVRLWGCNTSDAQRWWEPGDRTLRALGKCLDVSGGGTANATGVQLFDCNGTAAQQWVTRADATILNPASNRCLDDAGGLQRAGDRLQIYDCNATAAQGFRLG
jgi:hypothetical protein